MAMNNRAKLEWSTLKMTAEQAAAYAKVTQARQEFEAAVLKGTPLPTGKTIRFSYKYDKPSIAIDDVAGGTGKRETLAEYLARTAT